MLAQAATPAPAQPQGPLPVFCPALTIHTPNKWVAFLEGTSCTSSSARPRTQIQRPCSHATGARPLPPLPLHKLAARRQRRRIRTSLSTCPSVHQGIRRFGSLFPPVFRVVLSAVFRGALVFLTQGPWAASTSHLQLHNAVQCLSRQCPFVSSRRVLKAFSSMPAPWLV